VRAKDAGNAFTRNRLLPVPVTFLLSGIMGPFSLN